MRGTLASARALGAAIWLTSLASTSGGCSRSWVLADQPGSGGSGSAAAGGANGGTGSTVEGGAGGANGGAPAGGGGPGGMIWMGGGGRGRGGAGASGGIGGPVGSGGFGFPPGSGGGVGSGCSPAPWRIDVADLIFVVAHSQSMATPLGDMTRATAVIRAIESVVDPNQNAVNFGYHEFPSRTGCMASANGCCVSEEKPWLKAGYLTDMTEWMLSCDPGQSSTSCLSMTDGRPIAPALMKTHQLFTPSDGSPKRFVVLITDGPPGGCGEDPNEACTAAVTAVSDLAHPAQVPMTSGVVVPVVPLGDDATGNACLKMMATQGGYFPQPPPAPIKDFKTLSASLTQIVSRAADDYCTIRLNATKVDPSSYVWLWANGHFIGAHDTNNGWEFSPPDQSVWIRVYGEGCRTLQKSPLSRVDVEMCPTPSP